MIPLSTLVEVLQDYKKAGLDGPGGRHPIYEEHMLAAFLLTKSFTKMVNERLPQAALTLAATVAIQSWLEQDASRWATTYKSALGYTTELMNGDKTLEVSAESPTMAESLIKAAEGLGL